MSDAAPAPIAIGVTGHRPERLAAFDTAALADAIERVLVAIADAAPGTSFRLVGSFAEGADTIVADAALARGWPIDAVLPFAREEYGRDFDPAAAAILSNRLNHAQAVFELPGARDEPGGSAAAYERAGRVVLAQSDLLLAIWDGDPPRGRGGAAQIVAEAVSHGIPVLTVHPDAASAPVLLWSGLDAHEFGPETVDTVAHGGLGDLPRLLAALAATGQEAIAQTKRLRIPNLVRPIFALAYPLLLAATGVRGLRRSDLTGPRAPPVPEAATEVGHIDTRIEAVVRPPFAAADLAASLAAQSFRSAFVSNFGLAAFAVLLSLLGLLAPHAFKPVLVVGEFAAIATILLVTRIGRRSGWHRRWLDERQLAERLRCLEVSAPLGDLFLRGTGAEEGGGSCRAARAIARRLGLPAARVDDAYLGAVHARFLRLLDEQIDYLRREAGRMHRLEHRLHRVGGVLFAITALICVGVLLIEGAGALLAHGGPAHALPIGFTVVSATLPAFGAAIYGIRMQGDFAGVAERNTALAAQLAHLRTVVIDEPPQFDGLRRLIRRTTELLTQDVTQWFRASLARPLSLPG